MTTPQSFPYPPAPAPGPQFAAQFAPQFSSQIPVEQTRLSQALRSEWTKIRTVRSTMWTLGVLLALVIGVTLLFLAPLAGDETIPVLTPGLFGVMFGQIAVVTLGVLVITSEFGTGMIRTTLTSCPQRSRVLAAKAIVFFCVSFAATTLACAVAAALSWSVMSGQTVAQDGERHPGVVVANGVTTASGSEWLGATVGVGLYVALLGLLALAVGTMLRHSAGAITTMIGVVLLPLVVALFLPVSMDATRINIIRFSSPNALACLYRFPMVGSDDQTGGLQLLVLAGVTAVALIAAFLTFESRDV